MRIFNLGGDYSVVCRSENTRNGFRHLAVLMDNGREIDNTKICYQNRTWERFEFQSVAHKILDNNQELKQRLMILNELNEGDDLLLSNE